MMDIEGNISLVTEPLTPQELATSIVSITSDGAKVVQKIETAKQDLKKLSESLDHMSRLIVALSRAKLLVYVMTGKETNRPKRKAGR